jgi:ArsR family transcriptional regulator
MRGGAVAKRKLIDTIVDDDCCGSILEGVIGDHDAAELARGFAAIADPVRIKILSILGAAQAGEVCACDFVAPTGRSQPTVSHHLKILSEAGLVTGDKRGRWVWYRLVPDRLEALRGALHSAAPQTA